MKAIGVKERTPEQWHKLIKKNKNNVYSGTVGGIKTEEEKKCKLKILN